MSERDMLLLKFLEGARNPALHPATRRLCEQAAASLGKR